MSRIINVHLTLGLPDTNISFRAVSWSVIVFKTAACLADMTEAHVSLLVPICWLGFAVLTRGMTERRITRVAELVVFDLVGRRSVFLLVSWGISNSFPYGYLCSSRILEIRHEFWGIHLRGVDQRI